MYLASTKELLETIREHETKIQDTKVQLNKNLDVNEDIMNNIIKTLFEIIKLQDNRITRIESLLKK
tara:strand:+ start:492 stop:689 length:198 start_codon:yes stop_codon:yes gene_type:complete